MTAKNIWMPLYVGDYLADTGHLTTQQHGANLLLLMHYWRKRGLPTNDQQLAHIVKLTTRGWQHIKPAIASLFNDDWTHSQLDAELTKRSMIAATNAVNGSKGG